MLRLLDTGRQHQTNLKSTGDRVTARQPPLTLCLCCPNGLCLEKEQGDLPDNDT